MAENPETKRMEDNLVAYIKEKDARISKLEKDLEEATERRKQSAKVYEKLHPEVVKEAEKKEEAPPPHYAGSWQAFCPTCKTKEEAVNEGFKDETYCPNCFTKTGSIEATKHYYRCPTCGENAGVRATTDKYYKRFQDAVKEIKGEMPKLEVKE